MPTATEIVRRLDRDRFAEILGASPKNFREELFRRAGIKVKAATFSLGSTPKNQIRSDKLLGAIRDGLELGDDIFEELIRNYLYTRRTLLADALDHLKVKHDNGLTEEDLAFINDLSSEKSAELRASLESKHLRPDVELYFAFMNIPGA